MELVPEQADAKMLINSGRRSAGAGTGAANEDANREVSRER